MTGMKVILMVKAHHFLDSKVCMSIELFCMNECHFPLDVNMTDENMN
jgi:hypothetical protein